MTKSISVRYIVNDVDAAIEFYTKMLDFKIDMHPNPEFAILSQGDFKLYLTKPSGQVMPNGTLQTPGGWNRISIEVEDFDSKIEKLRKAGCKFRNDVVSGGWGKQILLIDPSGNLIELEQLRAWKAK